MSQQDRLDALRYEFSKYDIFIANAYRKDFNNVYLFSRDYQEFSVIASFLGIYISWETFLEQSFIGYLLGEATISGNQVQRFASPTDCNHANSMLIGTQKYVDWSNPDIVVKLANLYFSDQNPLTLIINSIKSQLLDLKTIRNACAHISSTTSTSLDALATRTFQRPTTNISVPQFILTINPNGNGNDTMLDSYLQYLEAAASNISQ